MVPYFQELGWEGGAQSKSNSRDAREEIQLEHHPTLHMQLFYTPGTNTTQPHKDVTLSHGRILIIGNKPTEVPVLMNSGVVCMPLL